jgi:hypothetical protein
MTQCWFQQRDSKTNLRSSLLSEVAGSLEESNIRITQNVSKKDNINLILKEKREGQNGIKRFTTGSAQSQLIFLYIQERSNEYRVSKFWAGYAQ